RRRLFLWTPAAMGLGILLYVSADREPALLAPVPVIVVAALLAWLGRERRALLVCSLSIAAVAAGFAAATWRTAAVTAPMLERPRIGRVAGFVESVEARAPGARLVLRVTDMPGLAPEQQPRRVRMNAGSSDIAPGQHITVLARLLPPPGPARPGGYDFRRDAFFKGIGAVGSIPGRIVQTPNPPPLPEDLAVAVAIDRARNALTERIAEAGGGQAGAMAAALVTGKRGRITEATNNDLRAAGIFHIVSISGLHMVLAAGTIFWLLRAVLALSQMLALRWPIKKIAALAAMLGATAYCVFSGAEVATVRSLIMTLVMLGATLVDRPALSMRNLALAAIIVLLREPDALLGPSFQMSFGAVAALIAFAERWEERSRSHPPAPLPWPLATLWSSAIGVLVTTLLATAATAPFGAYHFQSFNPFGLLGNALALPFISLIVMPASVFGVLAYPFGLDWPAWALVGLACDMVLRLAHWVAGFEHATMGMAAFGPGTLGLFSLSLLWVTLWTTRLRWLAILPLATGVATASQPDRPDILIERDGSGMVVRVRDGGLAVAGKPSSFVLQQWLTADGDRRSLTDPSLRTEARCDAGGCLIRARDGRFIAYASDRVALIEDCRRADLVVTPIPWGGACKAKLIDRMALARDGATAMRIRGGRWSQTIAERPDAERPWMRKPP
ncbi:MAG: ComEC/Rec2 family competence protein, partial [Bosea sp. (in: a-proteobacteria)]